MERGYPMDLYYSQKLELFASNKEAIDKAYESASKVTFQDMHMRKDIGQRALKALQ
jgi:phosphoribosylamine--glycine ligase